jgi:hypothetical protein
VLNPDFKEFIASLNANGVRYLVVGGYAVAFHGHPRYTKDLDVWIDAAPENAERIVTALDDFGFGSLGIRAEDFLIADRVIQLGFPPLRIDLLTTLLGVQFRDCYDKRVRLDLADVTVDVIDVESLKLNKRSTGRLQDLADAECLEDPPEATDRPPAAG